MPSSPRLQAVEQGKLTPDKAWQQAQKSAAKRRSDLFQRRPVVGEQRRAAGGRDSWRSRLTRADMKFAPYLFIAPFFVLFAIFGAFPLVYTGWVSLHDWHLIGEHTFVGFGNYTALFADPDFWNALKNTVGIFVLATVPQL